MKNFLVIMFFLFFISLSLKSVEKDKDTLRTYKLGEIITTDEMIKKINVTSSVMNMNFMQIHQKDAMSFSEISNYISSALIQTNSRGESQLFLRGSGERQLGLFFDGVQMNVPWDNRVDLSTIPTDLIGKITVNKGTSSILFGANITGGAININTIERANDGFGVALRSQFGDGGSQLYSLTGDGKNGDLNYIFNISYAKSDGILLPNEAKIGNDSISQYRNSSLRTNTDFNRLSYYARAEYEITPKFKTAISFNSYNVEKGVQALTEGAPSDLRYWRYPEINRNIFTINNFWEINDYITTKTVLWYDKFNQTIDSYSDLSYSNLKKIQKDDDASLGLRFNLRYDLTNNQNLNFVINYLNSKHNEVIEDNKGVEQSNNDFSQNTLSTGVEYKVDWSDYLISAGISYDYNENPETGEFTDYAGLSNSDYGAFFGFRYFLNDEINLFANTSRRTRFATMREAFSGALGKFKVNPDLKPETAWLNEVGIHYNYNNLQIELVGFYTLYDDLIDQIRLPESVDSLRRKQRVNYSKAMINGIEMNYKYDFGNSFYSSGYITYMKSQGKLKSGDDLDHLEYKPSIMSVISLGYKSIFGITPLLELQFIGEQWGIDPNDEWRKLDNTLLLNFRISYQYSSEYFVAEIYLRANNLTDELYWSKIGLLNPGRTISGGFVFRY